MKTAFDSISDEKFKKEIISLVQYVQRFREEIAQMVQRQDNGTHFENMADQLDAIVAATEEATHTILAQTEQIDTLANEIKASKGNPAEVEKLCDQLGEHTMLVMEACTFQDITGQRVNKIVRSMKFVEERVEKITSIWGKDQIEEMAKKMNTDPSSKKTGDEALLNGPALPKETAISQDEIDKLFD